MNAMAFGLALCLRRIAGGHALRLISTVLAVWMLHLARFDLARSERLHLDGDEAFGRSRERVRQTEALAARRCACASARK
jgi:hypothetical protein